MRLKRKATKNEELNVCINCGAIATDQSQLCNPEFFVDEGGCEIPQKSFNWFPVYGNCQPNSYVCSRCGREALSSEYLCDAKPV